MVVGGSMGFIACQVIEIMPDGLHGARKLMHTHEKVLETVA